VDKIVILKHNGGALKW